MSVFPRSRRVALTLALGGVLATTALSVGGSSASARDAREVPKIEGLGEVTTDVKGIAEQFGWDVESTAQHMADQAGFGLLIDAAATRFPKNFAGASFAEKPGAGSQIMVAGKAPGALVEMVAESGLDVEIIDGMKYSEQDQKARAAEIAKVLADQGHEDVVTAILPTGEIQVSVNGRTKADTKLPQHLTDDVQIAKAPGAVSTDEIDIKGGVRVYNNSTGGTCTSGFSVRRISDGMRGFATAAHCTGISRYAVAGPDVVTTFRGQHNSTFGDVEWHSTAENEIDNYIAGPSSTDERDVSMVWPANGYATNMVTCVHSRMQGQRTCDQIYSTNVSARGAGNLIATDNDNTVGGDSGGPWSFNTIADGIHKGDKWIWFGTRNVFSKAALLPAALGVEVMT